MNFLKNAGYVPVTGYGWKRPDETIIFDLYPGKRVYQTELLTSPLTKQGHQKIREWNRIYLGVLNSEDLIISKMFRGTETDIQDSLLLLRTEKLDRDKLAKRFRETAAYDVSETKVLKNLEGLLKRLDQGGEK